MQIKTCKFFPSMKVFACIVLLSNLFITAQADVDSAEQTLARQRSVYQSLSQMTTQPNTAQYRQLKAQLEGYPLAPYIEQQTLLAFPYLANQQKIEDFLARYQGTPLDWPLRQKWLQYLANKNDHKRFMALFKPTANVELTCRHLDYQLQQSPNDSQWLSQVEALWLVGESQPNECNPVFAAWHRAGLRTNEHVLDRLKLAASGGNHTLIPFLKNLLPESQRYLADLWQNVRRSPAYVSRLSKFPGRMEQRELEILTYGLGRLIWRDENLALTTWQQITNKFKVDPQTERQLASKFAVALANGDHEKAEQWLERANHLQADQELFRWHLAHVLRKGKWQHVIDIIELAPESIASELGFQYWQGRAYEQVEAEQVAQQQFTRLSQQRHYYGFLASGKLAKAPTIVDKPLSFDPQQLQLVAQLPAARRAYEFLQLQQFRNARREWYYLQSTLDNQQKLMSAVLADSWGWHDQAIVGFANAGYLDDVKRRFPMAYSDQLLANSQDNNIDPAWAFAIARRESSFMKDANSSAGAKGLMQLLPGTARYLAKKKVSNASLFDPQINTGYGTQYLRYLLDKMDNNPVLATASYNAGWRRVKSWIPEDKSMPADIWIETIPYKETRNYVKAVLAYRQIYAEQLGSDIRLFEDLTKMQLSTAKASAVH